MKKLKTEENKLFAKLIRCVVFTILGYQSIFLIINYPLVGQVA